MVLLMNLCRTLLNLYNILARFLTIWQIILRRVRLKFVSNYSDFSPVRGWDRLCKRFSRLSFFFFFLRPRSISFPFLSLFRRVPLWIIYPLHLDRITRQDTPRYAGPVVPMLAEEMTMMPKNGTIPCSVRANDSGKETRRANSLLITFFILLFSFCMVRHLLLSFSCQDLYLEPFIQRAILLISWLAFNSIIM